MSLCHTPSSNSKSRNVPIVTLTGPRSVGKTTVARTLAQRLQLDHFDSDIMIDSALQNNGSSLHLEMSRQNYVAIHAVLYDELNKCINRAYASNSGICLSVASGGFWNRRCAQLLADNSFTVLLLPVEDISALIPILANRDATREHFQGRSYADIVARISRELEISLPILEKYCQHIEIYGESNPTQVAISLLSIIKQRFPSLN